MAISAIALLRIKHLAALSGSDLQVTALEDAVLLHTGAGFACQPETLTRVVRGLVGDAIDVEHKDSRGIFFIPDVASPRARSYEAVIEEIGEGGVWGPLNVPSQSPAAALGLAGLPLGAADAEGLGALLGNILGQMPESMLQSVSDAARGQPGALEAASAQLRGMMGGSSDLSSLASQLSGALGPMAQGAAAQAKVAPAPGAPSPSAPDLSQLASMLDGTGIDLASMQALVGQVESALAQNPAQTAAMVERLFGSEAARELASKGASEDEDESDPPAPRTPPAKR